MRRISTVLAALVLTGAGAAPASAADDALVQTYHRVLLENTRFVESTWDDAIGSYPIADYQFVSTFGNAVLLHLGDYDADAAGVSRAELEDHTVRSIAYAAAHSRYVDPNGTWGGTVYWDAAFEAYFAAGAKLMWDQLDAATRRNVDAIIAGSADHIVALGADADTNFLAGDWRANTRMEEMGNRTMPLAAALAYLPDDAHASEWREWLDRWLESMDGLPAADQANATPVDGRPISAWTQAHNIFDTFIVENHGSYAPHYQASVGAYPGRDAAQFVIAGRPLPDALGKVANARELLATLQQLGTGAGVPAHLMVADRYHLYGRDVLPISYFATVLGDPYAAREERMLAAQLEPYVAYPPEGRLTKFSGEPKYEPEARAEVAMALLLHQWRGDVTPASEDAYFRHASGATDYGADVGLVAQQSPRAMAAAVTKAGYAKFAFMPQHDNWLFDISGASPSLLPAGSSVLGRTAHVYQRLRDGFDGTATMVRTPGGVAGYTTLPDGRVVYATSGTAADEGTLRVFNLDMPGVAGLDGDRTFTAADGSATLPGDAGGDGAVDAVPLPPTQARYVRMLGVQPATQFGYSAWAFEVRGPGSDADLALHRPTTASSDFGAGFTPEEATDGDPATRWAVARDQRSRADSWIAVDLGSVQAIDRVTLSWESAYGAEYRIQVSDDGQTWHDAAAVPPTATLRGNWLNVDGRAGFVIRNSANPIRVGPTSVTLSSGPAAGSAGMVIEGRPAEQPADTAHAAARPAPSGGPPTLKAALDDGYLSLFDLGNAAITGSELRIPQHDAVTLYRGRQRTEPGASVYEVTLAGADARLEPPRMLLSARGGGAPPADLTVHLDDSRTVRVANAAHAPARIVLRSSTTGDEQAVTVAGGQTRTVAFGGPRLPTDDLALARRTFPTWPLPAGMTDPERAVDGDPATAWLPGTGGRLVVDLGASHALSSARLLWSDGRVHPYELETSADGLTWSTAAAVKDGSHDRGIALAATARYVAVKVEDSASASAGLMTLAVSGND